RHVWLGPADFDELRLARWRQPTGDGKLDLITGSYSRTLGNFAVSVLPGDGDGTFGIAQDFAVVTTTAYLKGLAVGDFSGDGQLDVAVADHDNSFVDVLNTTSTGGSGRHRPFRNARNGSRHKVVRAGVDQDIAITALQAPCDEPHANERRRFAIFLACSSTGF